MITTFPLTLARRSCISSKHHTFGCHISLRPTPLYPQSSPPSSRCRGAAISRRRRHSASSQTSRNYCLYYLLGVTKRRGMPATSASARSDRTLIDFIVHAISPPIRSSSYILKLICSKVAMNRYHLTGMPSQGDPDLEAGVNLPNHRGQVTDPASAHLTPQAFLNHAAATVGQGHGYYGPALPNPQATFFPRLPNDAFRHHVDASRMNNTANHSAVPGTGTDIVFGTGTSPGNGNGTVSNTGVAGPYAALVRSPL